MRLDSTNCAPVSGLVSLETCIHVGGGELHTSCKPWLSSSLLKHATCPGFGGVWSITGAVGLLAPGLRSSGPRPCHKRLVHSGMKRLSRKEDFFAAIPATNRSRRVTSTLPSK